jgi:Na+/H+-dicarboxylate symporter
MICTLSLSMKSMAWAQGGTFVMRGRVLEQAQDRPIAQATLILDDDR